VAVAVAVAVATCSALIRLLHHLAVASRPFSSGSKQRRA